MHRSLGQLLDSLWQAKHPGEQRRRVLQENSTKSPHLFLDFLLPASHRRPRGVMRCVQRRERWPGQLQRQDHYRFMLPARQRQCALARVAAKPRGLLLNGLSALLPGSGTRPWGAGA